MTKELIRNHAYWVLRDNPQIKMNASEIARAINKDYGIRVSRWQVHSALRSFARSNKHFSIFPSFFPPRISYSVYILDEPFTPEIPKRDVKVIPLVSLPFDLIQVINKGQSLVDTNDIQPNMSKD